jgi:hypothetical protein
MKVHAQRQFFAMEFALGCGFVERCVKSAAESTAPLPLHVTIGQFLRPLRSDPEINRRLFEQYGW